MCEYEASPQADAEHFVLCRAKGAFSVLNRYPYTNGHVLIAPNRHVGDLVALSDDELNTLSGMIRDSIRLLTKVVSAHGFNVGMNINRCAGAGLPKDDPSSWDTLDHANESDAISGSESPSPLEREG